MSYRVCMKCGGIYVANEKNGTTCISCGSSHIENVPEEYNLTFGDCMDIGEISHDGNFILAMFKLKHENPIEYELKMRQFKALQEEANKPKCPKCGCTELGVANKGFGLFTGFLGSGKSMNVCKNCGYKWSPNNI